MAEGTEMGEGGGVPAWHAAATVRNHVDRIQLARNERFTALRTDPELIRLVGGP